MSSRQRVVAGAREARSVLKRREEDRAFTRHGRMCRLVSSRARDERAISELSVSRVEASAAPLRRARSSFGANLAQLGQGCRNDYTGCVGTDHTLYEPNEPLQANTRPNMTAPRSLKPTPKSIFTPAPNGEEGEDGTVPLAGIGRFMDEVGVESTGEEEGRSAMAVTRVRGE